MKSAASRSARFRNRLRQGPPETDLRRIDWRFLLPTPRGGAYEKLTLIGGTDGIGETLLDKGTARHICRALPDDASADAVVVLADGRCSPDDARRALTSDGVLWWEISRIRRPELPPEAFITKLRQAGLYVHRTYWVSSNHEHPRLFLPLDVPGALSWYLDSYASARSLTQRLTRRWLGDGSDSSLQRLARWVPNYAVVASVAPDTPHVPQYLQNDAPAAARCSPMMLSAGNYRVTLFSFAEHADDPVSVTKVPREAARNDHVAYEIEVLGQLQSTLPEVLRPSVPEPLGQFDWHDLVVTRQSFIRGSALGCYRKTARARSVALADVRAIGAWLRQYHAATMLGRSSVDELLRTEAELAIERYRRTHGFTLAEERLVGAYGGRLVELGALQIPRVIIHGDFMRTNVYRSKEHGLAVVDWESARGGPALYDLMVIVVELLVCGNRLSRDYVADFRSLLLATGTGDALIEGVRDEIDSYMTSFQIDRRVLPLMALYVLFRLGRRAVDRRRDPFLRCLTEVAQRSEEYLGFSQEAGQSAGRHDD